MKYVELESTQKRGNFVPGISIFSLKISEVIELLDKEIKHRKIVEVINKSYSAQQTFVKTDWREDIYKQIVGGV